MMSNVSSRRRGASAVEFALAFPFIVVVITASTDFAMWSFARQAVSRSVQDGARQASRMILPADATSGAPIEQRAEDTVLESLTTWGLNSAGASVDATWEADNNGRMWLSVTATVPYQSFFGLGSITDRPVSRTFVLYTQEQTNPAD